MYNCIMSGAKRKIEYARVYCPGLDEKVYLIADSISEKIKGETITTLMLSSIFVSVISMLEKEDNSFPNNATQKAVIENAEKFSIIIDSVADSSFSKEFRSILKDVYRYELPEKEGDAIYISSVPSHIKAACDWISNRLFYNLDIREKYKNMPCGEELAISTARFKQNIAKTIIGKLPDDPAKSLYIEEVGACKDIIEALKEVQVEGLSLPLGLSMVISAEEVRVIDGNITKVLWKK